MTLCTGEIVKFLVYLLPILQLAGATSNIDCPSIQYFEKGTKDSLFCQFLLPFQRVVWYITPNNVPLIASEDGITSGRGYESGEFDISSSGLLQIKNVSVDHDRTFRVVVLYSEEWTDNFKQDIRVTVYIKPAQSFPKVDVCANENSCLVEFSETIRLTCSLSYSRPTAELQWIWMSDKEHQLHSKKEINESDHNAYSTAVINVEVVGAEGSDQGASWYDQGAPWYDTTSLLTVCICRAVSEAPLMEITDTVVWLLLQKEYIDVPEDFFDTQLVEVNKDVLLDIKVSNIYAAVWKKLSSISFKYETIGLFTSAKSKNVYPELQIKEDGSLEINQLKVHHEGVYICIYEAPTGQGIVKFEVNTLILPSPAFPKIIGCPERDDCQLQIGLTGTLTCTLRGIRPLSSLYWSYLGKGPPPIKFKVNTYSAVKRKRYTVDLLETVNFEIDESHFIPSFYVSCRSIRSFEEMPELSSTVLLNLNFEALESLKAKKTVSTKETERAEEMVATLRVWHVAVILCVSAVLCSLSVPKKIRKGSLWICNKIRFERQRAQSTNVIT